MMLDDEKLFDFDKKRLDHWKKSDSAKALTEHPDVYRNHLVIAKFLDGWRERAGGGSGEWLNPERTKGIQWALKEVAAHLRQGDLLPSGILYQQTETDLTK